MKPGARICCTLLPALLVLAVPVWAAQVQVCHVPPGNPSNFHTITINDTALQAHLAHGDLAGTCFAHCDTLCSDGNPCTIDACDASEQCLITHPPVNCDDSNLCTTDTCNPASGCESTPKTCLDNNLCSVDSCDPLTGNCVFPPVACPAGQTCNSANGRCEAPADPCAPNPCQNGGACFPSPAGSVDSDYVCVCPSGWTGTSCEEDINECALVPDPCADWNGCENFPGGYICIGFY